MDEMHKIAAVSWCISAMSLAGCVTTPPQPQRFVTTAVTLDKDHSPASGNHSIQWSQGDFMRKAVVEFTFTWKRMVL